MVLHSYIKLPEVIQYEADQILRNPDNLVRWSWTNLGKKHWKQETKTWKALEENMETPCHILEQPWKNNKTKHGKSLKEHGATMKQIQWRSSDQIRCTSCASQQSVFDGFLDDLIKKNGKIIGVHCLYDFFWVKWWSLVNIIHWCYWCQWLACVNGSFSPKLSCHSYILCIYIYIYIHAFA